MKNLLFALCLVMLGCDSGESSQGDGTDAQPADSPVVAKDGKTVTTSTDAGVFCQVPMPTGELAQKPARYMLTNTDVVGKCELLRQQPPKGAIWNGKEFVGFGMVDCKDAAHDFAGSTGLSWCLTVTNCQANQVFQTCDVATFWIMEPPRPQRGFAVCSASGGFLGWSC